MAQTKPWIQRLAVCSWSLKPTGCQDLILALKKIGIERTQLHLDPLAAGAAGWEDAGRMLAGEGVQVVSGMVMCHGEDYSSIAAIHRTGGVVPDETWPRTRQMLAAAAPVAQRLGLKLVTFHAGFVPEDASDPVYGKVVRRLVEAGHLFGEHGVDIGLETGQESPDALGRLLNEVAGELQGACRLFANFDPANMILYGSGEPVASVRQLGGHVRQVHLKDALASAKPGVEWGSEVPVGEGEVDWPAFFAALNEIDFAGDLCFEREAGGNRIDDIAAGHAYLQQTLKM